MMMTKTMLPMRMTMMKTMLLMRMLMCKMISPFGHIVFSKT